MKKTVFIVLIALMAALVCGSALAAEDAAFQEALEHYRAGKYEESVSSLSGYVRSNPDPRAYYLMGYALYALDRQVEATRYFDEAYLIDPEMTPKIFREALGLGALSIESPKKAAGAPASKAAPAPAYDKTKAATAPAYDKTKAATAPAYDKTKAATAPAYDKTKAAPKVEVPAAPVPEAAKPKAATAPAYDKTKAATAPAYDKTKAPPAPAAKPRARPVPTPMPSDDFGIPGGIPPGMKGLVAFIVGIWMVFLAVSVIIYLFFSYCLFRIGKATDTPASWLAFVPIIRRIWPVIGASGKPLWWIILMLLPVVSLIVGIILWMSIAERLGKSKVLGILMILPVVNLIVIALLAFSAKKEKSVVDTLELPELPGDFDSDEYTRTTTEESAMFGEATEDGEPLSGAAEEDALFGEATEEGGPAAGTPEAQEEPPAGTPEAQEEPPAGIPEAQEEPPVGSDELADLEEELPELPELDVEDDDLDLVADELGEEDGEDAVETIEIPDDQDDADALDELEDLEDFPEFDVPEPDDEGGEPPKSGKD